MDDLHHPLDLLRRDGPRSTLLPQQVHHVSRELAAGLLVLLKFLERQSIFISICYRVCQVFRLVLDEAK